MIAFGDTAIFHYSLFIFNLHAACCMHLPHEVHLIRADEVEPFVGGVGHDEDIAYLTQDRAVLHHQRTCGQGGSTDGGGADQRFCHRGTFLRLFRAQALPEELADRLEVGSSALSRGGGIEADGIEPAKRHLCHDGAQCRTVYGGGIQRAGDSEGFAVVTAADIGGGRCRQVIGGRRAGRGGGDGRAQNVVFRNKRECCSVDQPLQLGTADQLQRSAEVFPTGAAGGDGLLLGTHGAYLLLRRTLRLGGRTAAVTACACAKIVVHQITPQRNVQHILCTVFLRCA